MPAASSFSYATIRVVPRVEREEFINVGVVLHCPAQAYLGARVALDRARVLAVFPGLDAHEVERHLQWLCALCTGDAAAGPLAALSTSERFHFIVASRSTVVQTSPVHAGLTSDPEGTLTRLLDLMVGNPA